MNKLVWVELAKIIHTGTIIIIRPIKRIQWLINEEIYLVINCNEFFLLCI
jgi:hypothetical protein